ncbi:ankyrin repeat, PH and SEC7 domain containing protein secG-like [Lytechinus variegatus]|uniref:ankyrin repeat, PH and SEC7 domain containing protein secG-like n=1 Tax=Lytechinus variegatus TaxID=7654 RepID=UPI001BB27269|nr:ankyrin repeat, PH and SEC7 domain containing protein secG-like [Lytechinus variegatus]
MGDPEEEGRSISESSDTAENSTKPAEGDTETTEKDTMNGVCIECGKPPSFYSIYDRQKILFCSSECHGKRNEKERSPNLMLVKLVEKKSDDVEDKANEEKDTDELVDAALDQDIFECCHGGLTNNTNLHKLLEGGADVNQKDPSDQPLLIYAVANGDVTTINLLLEKGADINQRGKGQTTPLMTAADIGAKEKVSFLLSKDADTILKDDDGKTALHRTERNRNTKCAELLIEKNPELLQARDNCQQTILHQAAGEGNKDLVEFLLEKDADLCAMDNLDRSALHWAVIQGMESVVENLLERDCSKVIDLPDRFGVRSIHYAIQSNRADIAELLIGKGCELEAGESRGLTALIYAVACGKKEMLNIMIPRCKNIDITDKKGWTALHHAAKRGDDDVCILLLDHQAKSDVKDSTEQQTPLIIAVNSKQLGVVKILIERTPSCKDITDAKGRSSLHYAAANGYLDILSVLLDTTGDSQEDGDAELQDFINSKDSSGYSALYLAAKNNHRDCCKHLIDKGAIIEDSCRDLLFELGLIDPQVEEEENEDRSSTSSRQRYGVDETSDETEKIEDLDLGKLTDNNAVALNSRYIYEGKSPAPKSTSPRRPMNVIPRRATDVDDQETFNVHWKNILEKKRRAEQGVKTRRSKESLKSPYAQPLVNSEILRRYEGLRRAQQRTSSGDSTTKSTVTTGYRSNRIYSGGSDDGSKTINTPVKMRSKSSYSQGKKYSYSVVTR